jgi:hypothetical protein
LDTIQESRPPSPPQSELAPDTSASEDEPDSPPGQTIHEKSASTPSLPSLPFPPVHPPSAISPPSFSLGHKVTRSVGPSMFERVISKTRPSFLPPKSKHEDQKHMADWEKMMKRSRAAGIPYPTYPKKLY